MLCNVQYKYDSQDLHECSHRVHVDLHIIRWEKFAYCYFHVGMNCHLFAYYVGWLFKVTMVLNIRVKHKFVKSISTQYMVKGCTRGYDFHIYLTRILLYHFLMLLLDIQNAQWAFNLPKHIRYTLKFYNWRLQLILSQRNNQQFIILYSHPMLLMLPTKATWFYETLCFLKKWKSKDHKIYVPAMTKWLIFSMCEMGIGSLVCLSIN